MNVTLTQDQEKLVADKVASGLYNSASEVVREALQLLHERDTLDRLRHEELRRDIAIGVAQADRGELAPLDMEEIKAEGRRLLAEKRK